MAKSLGHYDSGSHNTEYNWATRELGSEEHAIAPDEVPETGDELPLLTHDARTEQQSADSPGVNQPRRPIKTQTRRRRYLCNVACE
jgi:hypothetical protein